MADRLTGDDFGAFFQEVYGREPFPWQRRLALRVVGTRAPAAAWPEVIALPTASGKTACIDIAVFALACQADWPAAERTAARRIFFVVDRRIIVDEAFDRARALAEKLEAVRSGIVGIVAERLRSLDPRGDAPLRCVELRGGMYRDERWARTPAQPTIVTSTVDQIGSRLLFRGYGLSPGVRPVHAGLIGNDSLIILDEAHCANPFRQTLASVSRYRSWAERPLPGPFGVVTMSATPQEGSADVFSLDADDRGHDVLKPRLTHSKPTRLVVAEKAKGGRWREALVETLVAEARKLRHDAATARAVAVIVNRVATAKLVCKQLRDSLEDATLLIGRMRPRDRDAVVGAHLEPFASRLRDGRRLDRPVFVVATQCLEVGADVDFDALVSECASLDALRQRFGRLNRMGALLSAPGVIVVRADQTETAAKPENADPVYGDALPRTWQWLTAHARDGLFDLGVDAVAHALTGESPEAIRGLVPPSLHAPVMLPAHVDCWVQTSPEPMPSPEPAVFLHGPERGEPDVSVCWRADLIVSDDGSVDLEAWRDAVSLCPPSSTECMRVLISAVRRWLQQEDAADDSDVEGPGTASDEEPDSRPSPRPVLRWRGAESEETRLVEHVYRDLAPGDILVIPETVGGWDILGAIPENVRPALDCADECYLTSRGLPLLRFQRDVIQGWQLGFEAQVAAETLVSCNEEPEDGVVDDTLWKIAAADDGLIGEAARYLAADARRRVLPHPLGGLVIQGRKRVIVRAPGDFADEGDQASSTVPVTLQTHSSNVAGWATSLADSCTVPSELVSVFQQAGLVHDAGKADERFQALLHDGSLYLALAAPEPLAKSGRLARSMSKRREQRLRSGYPSGARHELASVRLVESAPEVMGTAFDPDLLLHLIASHHGCCRPFAPVVTDDHPVDIEIVLGGHLMRIASSVTGLERLDSGVADRFWRLVRRYGWWGLAWLEAVFRIADWRASEAEQEAEDRSTVAGAMA